MNYLTSLQARSFGSADVPEHINKGRAAAKKRKNFQDCGKVDER